MFIIVFSEEDIVLVPLSDIDGKVILIDIDELEMIVIGRFPNKIEKD